MPREDKPTITIYEQRDGAWVVEIDTTFEPDNSDDLGGMRVYLNDAQLYPGKHYGKHYEEDSQ